MPQRLEILKSWLGRELSCARPEIAPASADASFRRYFRVQHPLQEDGHSLIVMDAPPDKESTAPFIQVSRLLVGAGLHAPQVLAADSEAGFLLLTDLGQTDYLSALSEKNVDALYADALNALLVMHTQLSAAAQGLPPYDARLLRQEMELFREWYLKKHLILTLSAEQEATLDRVFSLLTATALAQPRVFVHRDYHSRNLMVTAENNPGILDFQDAMYGPVTYDLVSLLRDCYIAWPRAQVEQWALDYLHRLQEAGMVPRAMDDQNLLQWFDWMGVQRHLKATGIFARLSHRDHKHGYLQDIPRTLGYVREVCGRYPALTPLAELLADIQRSESDLTASPESGV
jgi:aminoglycoside/choline kinase family phosphotransferase